jgi:uncharacterized membrane protein
MSIGFVMVILVLMTISLWITPTLSRPGIFFGVTVPPGFEQRPEARAWTRRFRSVIAAATSLVALALLTGPAGRWRSFLLLTYTVVTLVTWSVMHRSVRRCIADAATSPGADVRVATLTPRSDRMPGGAIALAGPFVIIIVAALVLGLNWDAIPEQLPAFGRGARGSVSKSISSVFGPLLFVGALLVAFTLQTFFLVRRTRQIAHAGDPLNAEIAFKRRSAAMSLIASYLMAIGPSAVAVQRALGSHFAVTAGGIEALYLGAIVVFTIVVFAWTLRVGQGGQRHVPQLPGVTGDRTPDTAWLAGLLYFNPSDPSVFVERRMGVGWSPNFGNVWTWVLLVFAIGVPVFILQMTR